MENKKTTMEPVKFAKGAMASRNELSLVKQQLNFIKEKVLPTLCRMKEARPFLMPVDPVEHNMPDYLDIISFPMDLGTIRSRLNFNFYQNLNECYGDFKRMFSNAFLYFSRSSSTFNYATLLETALKTLLRNMPKNETKERAMPTTLRPQSADKPTPVEPIPEMSPNLKLGRCLEKSQREILSSKVKEPSSVTTTKQEAVFKIPIPPARKRMRMERSAERMPELSQPGNGTLHSSTLTSIQTISSPSIVGSPSKSDSDISGFESRYRNKQLELINSQMGNLETQLRLFDQARKEGLYKGLEALLDQQAQLSQTQKEWLRVRNLEEYDSKNELKESSNLDPQ